MAHGMILPSAFKIDNDGRIKLGSNTWVVEEVNKNHTIQNRKYNIINK